MNVIFLNSRWRRPLRVSLERDDLERHAEDLGDFLGETPVLAEFVTHTPESATHDLFAQKLGHERTESDDVRHRVAIPPLGEHSDTD
jgi:hypothetical protein